MGQHAPYTTIGTKFEIWLEQLYKDLEYSFVQRNIRYYTKEKHIFRQVDIEYHDGLFHPINSHVIIEAKYLSYSNLKLQLRSEKNKINQKINSIDTILDEVEERRQFVKARKAIIVTNQTAEKQLYTLAQQYRRIEIVDANELQKMDQERRTILDFFRTRPTIEQQINNINIKNYRTDPIYKNLNDK